MIMGVSSFQIFFACTRGDLDSTLLVFFFHFSFFSQHFFPNFLSFYSLFMSLILHDRIAKGVQQASDGLPFSSLPFSCLYWLFSSFLPSFLPSSLLFSSNNSHVHLFFLFLFRT